MISGLRRAPSDILIALAPAAPIVAIFLIIGQFLREETDEVMGQLIRTALLWSGALTLCEATVWGFPGNLRQGPEHLDVGRPGRVLRSTGRDPAAGRAEVSMNNRLRVLRAERNWSQADLAQRLDVSRQSVNAIETGKYDPSLPLAFPDRPPVRPDVSNRSSTDETPDLKPAPP